MYTCVSEDMYENFEIATQFSVNLKLKYKFY